MSEASTSGSRGLNDRYLKPTSSQSLLGAGSRWGAEDQDLHARYEKVVRVRADAKSRKIEFLQLFIKKKAVAGNTAEELAPCRRRIHGCWR